MLMQTAYVNTDQLPSKILRLGVFKYVDSLVTIEGSFFEMCEVFYPHPDAPAHASLSVFQWLRVKEQLGTKDLIIQAIKAMTSVGEITSLL